MFGNNNQEREDNNTSFVSNQQYVNNTPFMLMRLDTAPLLNDIKNFLSSKEIQVYQDENGDWNEKLIQVGLPIANDEGIMRICNIVKMRINKDVVQGNLKEEHYWDFIARARKEITDALINKCYDWEVHDSNLDMIINEICALIEGYLTRPINNKEREGYGTQVQAKENTIIHQPRGGIAGLTEGMGRS